MVKLERCPFCGTLSGYSRVPGQGFSVVCRGRGCRAVAMLDTSAERDDVGRGWNRRARPRAALGGAVAPCPFCGGSITAGGLTASGLVHCPHCGMMVSFPEANDLRSCVAHWNQRW